MRRCRDQGIWALVWERGDAVPKNARAARRRRRADGDDQEDEEEEEEEEVRKVSERGWQVIEWLVALWEKDQALHPDLGECISDRLSKLSSAKRRAREDRDLTG